MEGGGGNSWPNYVPEPGPLRCNRTGCFLVQKDLAEQPKKKGKRPPTETEFFARFKDNGAVARGAGRHPRAATARGRRRRQLPPSGDGAVSGGQGEEGEGVSNK
jgi:hypothetical protein